MYAPLRLSPLWLTSTGQWGEDVRDLTLLVMNVIVMHMLSIVSYHVIQLCYAVRIDYEILMSDNNLIVTACVVDSRVITRYKKTQTIMTLCLDFLPPPQHPAGRTILGQTEQKITNLVSPCSKLFESPLITSG